MIQLESKSLPKDVLDILTELQKEIDSQPTFSEKVNRAKSLWITKGGIKGKKKFEVVVSTLRDMCVYVGVCNYCEQNEANDIEHIYPKSFFPASAFTWENYLLACKQCNSGFKLDKCYVLDANGDVVRVERSNEPAFQTGAFINPRIENPNDFLILNLKTFKFSLIPFLSKIEVNKAEKTLDILELNTRDTLKQARKSASQYYFHRLDLLIRILNATSIQNIKELLTPHDDQIDDTLSITELKDFLKLSFKNHIIHYQHPSVWYSIKKIESKTNEKWKAIFEKLPEAHYW